MSKHAIAIVGAGLAGLYAARLLKVEGADSVLIEARDRLALAGSETSSSEPGYLAGAVVAAKRAVVENLGR